MSSRLEGPKPPENEKELVHRAFAGDTEAFGAIVTAYQRPVYSLCIRFLGRDDAEDAAQEVFLKAFVKRERFDVSRPLLPWLLTIARHLCIDKTRGKTRLIDGGFEPPELPDPSPDAEAVAATRDDMETLCEALSALPEGQREVVSMYHMDGLSYREIADAMEVPVGTVMTWLHRGRKKLKDAVSRAPKGALEPKRVGGGRR